MCGILGVIAEPGAIPKLSLESVIQMRDRMMARGPDGCGNFQHQNVIFAHRRLAIRDIEGGQQPWTSKEKQVVLVFNGEIYNDDALREQLLLLGHQFQTRSDTEVLMEAYLRWGERCVDRLRGMFAFAIYDFRNQTLLLVRDRFGVKPLFFSEIRGDLVFSSTVDAILKHPSFRPAPSLVAMSHYLSTQRQTIGRQTLYEGIWQLMPGERLLMQSGKVQIQKYWNLPLPFQASEKISSKSPSTVRSSVSQSSNASSLLLFPRETSSPEKGSPKKNSVEKSSVDQPGFEDCESLLFNELKESTKLRMKSDVPVGLFLSGGVDSNTLAHLMHETTGKPFHTACADGSSEKVSSSQQESQPQNQDAQHQDAQHAALCAKEVGCDLQTVSINAREYRQTWDDILEQTSLPLTTPSDVLIHQLAKETRKHVGVVLGGEGADELLCGYNVQHWSGEEYDAITAIHSGQWTHGSTSANQFLTSIHKQYGRIQFESPADHYFALNSFVPIAWKPVLFREKYWKALDSDRVLWNHYNTFYQDNCSELSDASSTSAQTSRLLHQVNLEALLSRLDTATMLASLEARVPFTDHHLVESIWNTPQEHRISLQSNGSNKHYSTVELNQAGLIDTKKILRSGARRLMSEQLANRPKASFPTPVSQWLGGEWKDWAQNQIQSSPFGKEFFDPEVILAISENSIGENTAFWPMLNLVQWGDRQFAA